MKADKFINILGIICFFSVTFAIIVSINAPKDFLVTIKYSDENQVADQNQNTDKNKIAETNEESPTEENYIFEEIQQESLEEKVTTEDNLAENTATELEIDFPLDLNHITYEELLEIPGIGHVTSTRIVQYRDYLGGYSSLEQLMEIKGIGEGTFKEISAYLYLS